MNIEAFVDRRGFLQTSAVMAASLALAPSLRSGYRTAVRQAGGGTSEAITPSCRWGAYCSPVAGQSPTDAILALETKTGRALGITRHYQSWGAPLPGKVIGWSGSTGHTPYVAWAASAAAPWGSIASGAQDAWITTQAQSLKSFGYPMYFCFHHEPENDTSLGSASDFVAAYAHVKNIFDSVGASNLTWVVTLMASTYSGGHGGPSPWIPPFFDLLGVDGYNRNPCVPNQNTQPWKSFSTLMAPARATSQALAKGLFVGEYASVEQTANGNTSGDPNAKAQWFADAVTTIKAWPEVKGACYSHTLASYRGYAEQFWADTTPQALASFTAMGRDPYFA